MAAVANTAIQVFNIEQIQELYTYDTFVEKCKRSLQLGDNHYCIQITTNQEVSYHCSVYIDTGIVKIYFLGTDACYDGNSGTFPTIPFISNGTTFHQLIPMNPTTFLYIFIFNNNDPASSSLTTNVDFTLLHHNGKSLNKLETIIYIRCYFYRMLSIKHYFITDMATGTCNTGSMSYMLFVYRLFRKVANEDKDINANFVRSLSIYYKYFTRHFDQDMKEIDFYNGTMIKDIKELRSIIYNFDKNNESIVEHFATFTTSSINCEMFAKELVNVHTVLLLHNTLYAKILDYLTNFRVSSEDCIYYPKGAANAGGALHHKKIKRTHRKHLTKSSSYNRTRNACSRMTRRRRVRKSSFS